MPEDMRGVLERAAHKPDSRVDYARIDRAARGRRRLTTSIRGLAGVAVIAAAGTMVNVLEGNGRESRTHAAESDAVEAFLWIPNRSPAPSAAQGTQYRIPLILPDGTSLELTVAASTGLGASEVAPSGGARLPGIAERDFVVPEGGLAWFASLGMKERDIVKTDDKTVSLWSVTQPGAGVQRYLVFDFGAWVIGFWDGAGGARMTDAELEIWAQNLDAEVVDGYLVLSTGPRLELLEPGSGAGPAIEIGERTGNSLTVRSGPCASEGAEGPANVSQMELCRPEWGVRISVQGDEEFVADVASSLVVSRGA